MSEKMKNLITRSITGVIFVAVVVTCFLRPETMILVFALVTGLTVWEFTGLINAHAAGQVNRFITTAAGVYLFFAMAGYCSGITPPAVFIPYLLTVVYLFISELYLAAPNPINNWAYTMLSQMYIALPFSMINVLAFRADVEGNLHFTSLLPLSVFVFLWVNDTGAYLSGSLFGKHKLFPRVSPGKSWEGSIGGGLLVIAVAALMGWLETSGTVAMDNAYFSIPEWMGLGLIVVFFGTWGDLVESLFKRTLGIKDSGSILPGHGGMLDRFDSSLMALPAAVIYVYTLTFFA
jgi:phosphatidate cytidylyltransferase